MTKVDDVAKYISVKYKKLFNDAIDEMKLHKLLYFAQREYLAKYNKPLFDSKFEAWTYGPVVTSVREKLQDIISSEDIPEIDGIDVLNDVILQYAPIPSIELSKISHNESSWINARKGLGKYDKCSNQLSEEDIKNDGIKQLNTKPFSDSISKELKSIIDEAEEDIKLGKTEKFQFT